jgi:hypothetical protein
MDLGGLGGLSGFSESAHFHGLPPLVGKAGSTVWSFDHLFSARLDAHPAHLGASMGFCQFVSSMKNRWTCTNVWVMRDAWVRMLDAGCRMLDRQGVMRDA